MAVHVGHGGHRLRAQRLRSTRPEHAAPVAPVLPLSGEPTDDALPDLALGGGARSIDLRTDSLWRSVASSSSASPGSAPPAADHPPATAVLQMMKDAVDERDRSLGLGGGGVLVSAARRAATLPSAPEAGRASIEVDCDADGKVVSVRLREASSSEWETVRQELARILAARSVPVPAGARGLRIGLLLTAERQAPAGEHGTSHLGAVPDDVAGGGDHGCVGSGLTRKCLTGMPLGITVSGVDVSNLAARAVRQVRVTVTKQERL